MRKTERKLTSSTSPLRIRILSAGGAPLLSISERLPARNETLIQLNSQYDQRTNNSDRGVPRSEDRKMKVSQPLKEVQCNSTTALPLSSSEPSAPVEKNSAPQQPDRSQIPQGNLTRVAAQAAEESISAARVPTSTAEVARSDAVFTCPSGQNGGFSISAQSGQSAQHNTIMKSSTTQTERDVRDEQDSAISAEVAARVATSSTEFATSSASIINRKPTNSWTRDEASTLYIKSR